MKKVLLFLPLLLMIASAVRGNQIFDSVDLLQCTDSHSEISNLLRLYPIGWSPDGKFSFVTTAALHERDGEEIRYCIFDAVNNRYTFESISEMSGTEKNETGTRIPKKKFPAKFTAALKQNSIADNPVPVLLNFPIILDDDPIIAGLLTASVKDTTTNAEIIASYDIMLESSKRGFKKAAVMKSVRLRNIFICGYFKSPIDNRIIIVACEEPDNAAPQIRFFGTPADAGFIRPVMD
jgi:hypothetical protein